MAVVYQPSGGEFKHGLFSCCDSFSDCLLAYCCPMCYAYIAAKQADESTLTAALNCLFYPLCLCCLRGSARAKHGIEGGIMTDFCVTFCCTCCAVIQIKREFD